MNITIDQGKFKFQYLPDYAKFLLDNKLDEFVTVGIRFCRELDLPMMRPLSRITESELVKLSRASNREMLAALASNSVTDFILKNIDNYVNNRLTDSEGEKILDRADVIAEDIILAFYIRRKLFSFFLQSYTQNAVLHTLILGEVDYYTTQEHLFTTKAYIANTSNTGYSRLTSAGTNS